MKITVLGAGSAYGCPMSFNNWRDVDPHNPKNERTRASILIECQDKRFIVDAGPDFRGQVNKNNVPDVNAVFVTHGHYDHIAGIPELPRASRTLGHPIEVWASEQTERELRLSFGYLFNGEEPEGCGLKWCRLPDKGRFNCCGADFDTFQVPHHRWQCSAFRCGDFAYVTDWEDMPLPAFECLKGLRLLLIECNNGLVPEKNGHADLEKIKILAAELCPRHVVLTHLSARVDYDKTLRELPEGFELAYDGMILTV